MHSPSTLTEHVSLKLARVFSLDPVHYNSRVLGVRVLVVHPVLEVGLDLADALGHVHLARPPRRLRAQEHLQVAVRPALLEADTLEQRTDLEVVWKFYNYTKCN